ncbi:ACR3 family arsenite efflux pump ArsB [Natronospira proteinivora]|uniref:ACR3 family arsenite efflux pump ArsB n=1 Tax=Natronospira proteinivora TaxID=1807133 RepID=A0ABT1G8X9_9GAMM|nr:hypothetical protein [Natronospira proteinivora]MCP1727755.1 ACR3 family arsenite efflux pump ArsB [Natronospira proteinivora]
MRKSSTSWLSWRNLERWQLIPLLLAALAGLATGHWQTALVAGWQVAIWPLLGALLFTVFLNLDLRGWQRALVDRRFLSAVALMNFGILPLLTGLTLFWLPADPVIQFAVILVLLAPCTDWFLSFNLLGRGNPERATAAIPLLLAGQVLTIPFWITLFLGPGTLEAFGLERFLAVFVGLFLVPLSLALAAQRLNRRIKALDPLIHGLRHAPLFLLMAVIFLVTAVELSDLLHSELGQLQPLISIFLGWTLVALLIALGIGHVFQLAVPARRTLCFNAGSRNSFVVLPFALALPVKSDLATAVILLQAMLELGLLILLTHWIPRLIR